MSEHTLSATKLTRQQLEAGLNQMKEWFPEEAEKIDQHKETVLAHLVDGVEITADNPILEEKAAPQPTIVQSKLLGSTPCETQLAEFLAEGTVFFVTVAGCYTAAKFKTAINRWITSAFFETESYVSKLAPMITAFNAAEGKLAKAQAFAPIAKELWDTGAIQVLFDIAKSKSSYSDWLLDGAIAIGQIIVWVGTEFLAAVAEIAVVVLSAVHLLKSGEEAYTVCYHKPSH